MATLQLYTSQGERVGKGPSDKSDRVENFFFDGIRLHLDTTDEIELSVFFRARESESGRAEQYYAVYTAEQLTGLFGRFKRRLQREVEDELGMIIDTSSDDAQLVSYLDAEPGVPGTTEEQNAISSLLTDGVQLKLGVDNAGSAFSLVKKYVGMPTTTMAIVDEVGAVAADDIDVLIELGAYEGVEPLEDAVDAFDEQLRRTTAITSRPRATEAANDGVRNRASRALGIGKEILAVIAGVVIAVVITILMLHAVEVVGIEITGAEQLPTV